MSDSAIYSLTDKAGGTIRRPPIAAAATRETSREMPKFSTNHLWGEDALARFTACINLGRMTFAMIVFGGVDSAL